ncbi:hypothetical protein ZYGR_0AK02170 [Zygosaccharomyces rouxii]|uniref:Uncharacterized protein n=1 Tax=Zygosaccharomyces rouxii TaxID=4956 RepID=A0A1Q3ADL7_ZYGRO|nr:hypothetical protein ZYGR_0AK02170 [Zygosaccharomyces rouxii]
MISSKDRKARSGQNANSITNERKSSAPSASSTRGSTSVQDKPGFQKRMSLPTISVNDKPIRNRQGSLPGNPPTPIDKHFHGHVSEDLTSAATGMFSECMFKSPPKANNTSPPTHAVPSKPDWIDLEYLKRNPSNHFTSSKTKHRHNQTTTSSGWHNTNPSHYHGKRHPAKSYSSTFAPDRKRLVNQFLRSVDPVSSNVSTLTKEQTPATLTPFSGIDHESIDLGHKSSLQTLLYLDLEQLQRCLVKPPSVSMTGPPGSSSTSSVSSTSVLPEENSSSSSSLFGVSDESYMPPEFDVTDVVYDLNNEIWHNYNELDYFRKHVATQLHNFENVIKQNLREIIIKDEFEFQKSLQTFDSLVMDLKKLKQQVLQMYESIKNKSLVSLRREFDESLQDTFISRTNAAVEANVGQLRSLENRIEVSKQKLVQQKDTLRKMESLLSLKDDILASQRNTKLAYQYRYMVFDLGVFIAVIFICVLGKLLL